MSPGLKRQIIRAGLELFALPGVGRLSPRAAGRGLILTLHHVRPAGPHEAGPNAHLSVRPDFLDAALRTLVGTGLVPVRLAELPQRLADPADRRRFLAVTLDDGYRNNRDHAAPIFRALGMPYTIFVTPDFVRRRRSLWWETAEALAAAGDPGEFERWARRIAGEDEDSVVAALDRAAEAAGIAPLAIVDRLVMDEAELRALAAADPLLDLGAHTLTHVNLKRVDAARLDHEVRASADAVATYGGRRPASFAFPYGFAAAVGRREAAAVAAAGIGIAVTTQPRMLGQATGLEGVGGAATYGRISLNGLYQRPRFARALSTGWPARLA
jgi:peptidoglycan/xylan/chitin deacetylase (PgdA/CDA1 family)